MQVLAVPEPVALEHGLDLVLVRVLAGHPARAALAVHAPDLEALHRRPARLLVHSVPHQRVAADVSNTRRPRKAQ